MTVSPPLGPPKGTVSPPLGPPKGTAEPLLSAVVVHWRDEEHLSELLDAWGEAAGCEILVVDNSSSLAELKNPARRIDPGKNLGFGGAVNRGVEEARGEWILILNPDVRPEPDAVKRLLEALDEWTHAAGVVPALVDEAGRSRCRWQLRPLPSVGKLLLQAFLLPTVAGPRVEPERGTPIAQPAGAALAIRRSVLVELGGLDPGFFPAWFEDVDLAKRLAAAGRRLLYEPRSRWRHAGGASLPALGYGPFRWIYYRNLSRYLAIHHGGFWAFVLRCLLPLGMSLRLLALPLRCPQNAKSRREAAFGLLAVILGAASAWRRPRELRERFSREEP